MDIAKIGQILTGIALLLFVIFWIYHIVECLRRKDFRIFDKIFWTLILLVPILGLIMYRGIGNEFYKKKPSGKN
ncbi:MAG TPA: PLDc N-terminal domain-containing protein [bacterium]|nr:PLDc N-terminal domain-containing protein [bacterium]